jgi:hypothetical protein
MFRIRIRFMWIRIQPKISMQIRIQGANRIQIRIHDSLKQIFGDIMYEYIDMYGLCCILGRGFVMRPN